ncbi:hypothetical protein CMMCAS08_12120 [Clavibacter michiganensis subsp. michiganensis]|nr:hypothetical protein CMMCAS08_12120 [Clavibacter michiganensis subsp. michiganensis]
MLLQHVDPAGEERQHELGSGPALHGRPHGDGGHVHVGGQLGDVGPERHAVRGSREDPGEPQAGDEPDRAEVDAAEARAADDDAQRAVGGVARHRSSSTISPASPASSMRVTVLAPEATTRSRTRCGSSTSCAKPTPGGTAPARISRTVMAASRPAST